MLLLRVSSLSSRPCLILEVTREKRGKSHGDRTCSRKNRRSLKNLKDLSITQIYADERVSDVSQIISKILSSIFPRQFLKQETSRKISLQELLGIQGYHKENLTQWTNVSNKIFCGKDILQKFVEKLVSWKCAQFLQTNSKPSRFKDLLSQSNISSNITNAMLNEMLDRLNRTQKQQKGKNHVG